MNFKKSISESKEILMTDLSFYKGIIIIGQKKKYLGGPSGIIDGLENTFSKIGIPYKSIRLEDSTNKLKYIFKVMNAVRNGKNYCINVHTGSFFLCLFICFLSKIFTKDRSYYLTVHGSHRAALRTDGKKDLINEWIESLYLKKFSNLICVSEELRSEIQERYNRKKNIYVIPNATDIENYRIVKKNFPNDVMHFVLLGGVNRVKGVLECLELISFLKNHTEVPLILDIYGTTSSEHMAHEFETILIRYGLQNYVHYHGEVHSKKEIAGIFSNATFQLCLSHYDSFNVAIIEGMVVGCPAICSSCCGASYLITSNENGLIVDLKKNYLKKIYSYIKKNIVDEEFYQHQCKNAIKIAPRVRWENIANAYCKIMGVNVSKSESNSY